MVVLSIEDLSLEIAHLDSAHEGISYDICLRWRGEPLLNDAALKRRNKNPWAQRPAGAIEPRDSGREILPFLRKVLETNKSDYWVPDDPDIVLAIYTDDDVPFLPPKWTLLWEKPELTAERSAIAAIPASSLGGRGSQIMTASLRSLGCVVAVAAAILRQPWWVDSKAHPLTVVRLPRSRHEIKP